MDEVLRQFKDLKIPLEEIKKATNNFDDQNNCIGDGGFGRVYRGELSHSKGRITVAIKRLDRTGDQGEAEFLKELMTLSRYRHENLISLVGFCYQGGEAILVYELASHKSLDHHLDSPHLTWSQRIKICLGAAKGLRHLHDPKELHQRLIHCDVKSGNILLDDHWNAKVADFGFSIMGPANQLQSAIINLAAGTLGYCDPQYVMTHTLTKESDVYSFGVVLFEVLCGTLCCRFDNNGRAWILVPSWVESYEENKLSGIIFKSSNIQPIDQTCLETFSDIAYRCVNKFRKDRPKMAEVVSELEIALEIQEFKEGKLPSFSYEELLKSAQPFLDFTVTNVSMQTLSGGVYLNDGKTRFSINKKGEHCELISSGECVVPRALENYPWSSGYDSRFAVGTYHSLHGRFKARVRSQFLSPQITYTVNLVFKFMLPEINASKCHLIGLKYKLQGDAKISTSYLACEREDGWWMVELYQFTNHRRNVDLEILFLGYERRYSAIEVEGIEFRPLEKEDKKLDMKNISYTDANWEEKLPADYEDLTNWSKNSVQWTTEKEVYSILRGGFFINDGLEWFNLDKNGKKCHMVSAREANCIIGEMTFCMQTLPKSRFREAVVFKDWRFEIDREISYQLVSSQTRYAIYLVYKLPKERSGFEAPMLAEDGLGSKCYIYLESPQTPVIRPKTAQNTYNSLNRPAMKTLPQQRDDGWMEVQIWEFETTTTMETIPINLQLATCGSEALNGLIIEGIDFRPI